MRIRITAHTPVGVFSTPVSQVLNDWEIEELEGIQYALKSKHLENMTMQGLSGMPNATSVILPSEIARNSVWVIEELGDEDFND